MIRRNISLVLIIAMLLSTLSINLAYAEPSDEQGDGAVLAAAVTLTVDKNAAADDTTFNTIRDAVAKAKELNPQSEADRVTINVNPGDYEEQVKIVGMKYLTLRQTPDTDGQVDLHWYYCTGYCAGDCDLDGNYNPLLNWNDSRTWTGYNDAENGTNVEEDFTVYKLGQCLNKGDVVNYYTSDGQAHSVTISGDHKHIGDFVDQAALFIDDNSSDITVEDFNIVNSIPVMVTEGEKRVGVAPQECRNADHATEYVLPRRDNLTVCSESTAPAASDAINKAFAIEDDASKVKALEALTNLTAEQSAYLARSDKYNERGHAIAFNGDRIICNGIRVRGNQDSIWVGTGRMYFKDCDLIGGTDYIYGDASVVFDNCMLGAEGMTNKSYGATVTAANHDANNPYGYLFWNCTLYNVLDNIKTSMLGRPWRQAAQITFYKTKIDDTKEVGASAAGIDSVGWRDMSDNMMNLARFYEYGTYNASGKAVDTSERLVNESVEKGGTGMGSVLDEWQILEFNPRNYFNNSWQQDTKGRSEWDPMNFSAELTEVDKAIAETTITIPESEETTFDLPKAPTGIEFKWESASTNAVVSQDGTKVTVTRPAAGEASIETKITLYAMNTATGVGDKKEIPVKITPTTDTTNVYTVPVTINQSLDGANTYAITLTKNGALIKSVNIDVTGKTTTATLENIPVGTYDVKIVSTSDDFTITSPENGVTTITGTKGESVPLNITSQKIVDKTVDLGIKYSSTEGFKSYDLIDLAKKAADDDEVANSEIITVAYKMNVTPTTSGNSFIDILSTEPESSLKTSGVNSRFILGKLGHWNQLDMVDSAQSYSGSSNGDDQWLNACGKFAAGTPSTAYVTINYKTETLSAADEGSSAYKEYTFATFPSNYEKGKLYMGVYSGSETYEITNVKVTYKHLVTDEEANATPAPVPEGEGVYKYSKALGNITGGNQNNGSAATFVSGADETAKTLFADSSDPTKVDADLTQYYLNYLGNGNNGSNPSIIVDKAGKYRMFMLGYNNESGTKTVTVGDKVYTFGAGVDFATNAQGTLKLYTADIEVPEAQAGESIVIKTDATWLPDLYAIIVAGTKDLGLAPEQPTATPVPTQQPTATPAPTEDPIAEPAIKAAYVEDGSTVVEISGTESGVVVAAKYDDEETLIDMKTAELDGGIVKLDGIEADKVFLWNSLEEMVPLCDAAEVGSKPMGEVVVDFTEMSSVPVYSQASGQGFVEKSGAIMPGGHERQVAPVSNITVSAEGASVTESNGSYLHNKTNSDDGDDYNYGGMIYRIDTGSAGAYHIEVEVTGSGDDTRVAPTGMDASRLTGTSNWDNAGEVPRTATAVWSDNVWSYDFGTGQDFIEIEIEPKSLASASSPQTVGVKKITVTPIEVKAAGDKPTIHILGDSTQKTYTFNETISAWGQTLVNYFDPEKVNVINYSMGGRAMKSNYNEGRFDEILVTGREGDFVFIHSAHNDETISTNRFSRGSGTVTDNLAVNNEMYNKWLDMYVEAIKARGMTPVLVTAMPRTGSGKYSESSTEPNGFNPDSPANMRAKAASDPEVGLVELYEGAKAYIDSLDAKEVMYIYNNVEAGELPANNAANGANGDGTHYREGASKQWNRIMLQNIYDQSVAASDTYTDKAIMQRLVSLMPASVQNAAQTGDWSAVFPEMASDVSAVGVVPGATKQAESNYYYRNNIEKVLELGLMHKNSDNLFKPNDAMTVGEFATAMEKVFNLPKNSLTSYHKTYAELGAKTAEAAEIATASVDGDVQLTDGEYTVTVQQPEGGEVTVYNESEFHTGTVDVPSSVKANAVIGDNDYFTLTAPAEIKTGNDKNGVFSSNSGVSTNYVEIRKEGPVKRAVYTAKESGIMSMFLMFDNTKLITCENMTDGTKSDVYIEGEKADSANRANVYGEVQFSVEAGKTYHLYTNGGTGRLFGVMYQSNDYPQSTTSLQVSAGDEIRVVARPNDYYLNKAILVDGKEVATSKEYKFKVNSNVTVSAAFTAEPALVSETVIASDAALTREAMGAILYDAYLAAYGKDENGNWNKVSYMNQNGGVPSPDDPNYDPNIKYEGSPYIPLTGWGALTDISEIDTALYAKVKEVYNLGLMRSEQGIKRGAIACGSDLEPKVVVTRAKAAKTLNFVFVLTQPPGAASQKLPNGNQAAITADIPTANAAAPSTPIN